MKIKNAPFFRTNTSTKDIMLDVIIALIPVVIMSVVKFGFFSLVMIISGMLSAVLFEYIFQKATNKSVRIDDLSAALTGLLVGLSYPITAPIWIVILGSLIAILVKQIPGGIGRNTFNPAVFSRVLIKILFTPIMTNWVTPLPDLVSTATPLEFIGNGAEFIREGAPTMMDTFMGNIGGGIGETVKIAIIIGFIYLVIKKVIHPVVPIGTLVGVFLMGMLFGKSDLNFALYHVVSGTVMFAAVFMVTDYTTGPLNPRGKIYYALSIGLLTGVIRHLFNLPGGIGVAILLMNLATPLFDAFTTPRVFGHKSTEVIYENRH